LQWDLVQENVTWFGERGSAVIDVPVEVTAARALTETTAVAMPAELGSTSSPTRSELWRAGVQMWLTYPLLGVGPDNFRHVYGTYLGQTEFDDRITANSWYVELLATTGLMGVMAGMLLVVAAALLLRRNWRRLTTHSTRALVLGLSVALLTFFVHGLVDYFMEFTPTYGLFWLIAGLLIGLLTGLTDDEVAGTTDRL
jgi:O-antigen ligase